MDVSYKNTFWDIVLFYLDYMFRSRISQICFGVVLFVVGDVAIDVVRRVDFSTVGKTVTFLLLLCSGFTLFLLFALIVVFVSAFSSYRMHQSKWGECEIKIAENGLISEAVIGKSEIKWTGIESIKKFKNVIFIHISKQMGYVIPKRAFTQEADYVKFFILASEYWRNEKQKVSVK